ncbi:uncharacterized protein LOC122511819 [Leptopilina heterotoma]|uniref:uncharacterized protein LOC122511819 n=1 Tax=Leptopilina heterotoma TaxID=63436 RepID=UPI001CA849F3|nr:uncharacterized protein LOC122511819 [Leptopilina heterotoma]XP_043483250.1 uncharacterized protein LOC122511819 [Leptopilina heterotoma]
MERISQLFNVSLSKKFVIFILICTCLPLTIFQHVQSSKMEKTISESQGISDSLNRDLRIRRSLEGFMYRTINSAPCSKSGMFLNEKRKNGRWYWYCYLDESGRLSWMTMRCPNKRLFDPLIQLCVTNLTTTTESAMTTEGTTLIPLVTTTKTPLSPGPTSLSTTEATTTQASSLGISTGTTPVGTTSTSLPVLSP